MNWECARENLPPVLDLYRRLLVIQSRTRQRITVPPSMPDAPTVEERLGAGQPALYFADIEMDRPLFHQLCQETVAACREHSQVLGEVDEQLMDRLLDRQLAATWFNGNQPVQAPELSPLEQLCFQAIYRPFLQAYSSHLQRLIDKERWYRAYCPACGGSPDLAFLDKERGARHLVCSCCDTEWPFLRLKCPYCGNQKVESLAYYSTVNNGYRLHVCEECRTYVKTIDLRLADKAMDPASERLASCDLDYQGYQNGYHLSSVRVARVPGRI